MSPYPDGRDFAFTLVHDADSAYSRRLAPLFEVFDRLGLKLSVTVFALWADWADQGKIWSRWNSVGNARQRLLAPHAVPLADEHEQEFYKRLAERGHEIGLHSPSDTSDTRDRVIEALDLFRRVFGSSPRVYVEHSARSNKDAQANEGANPQSRYYNSDLLTALEAWVWVDGPGGLADDGPTFFEINPATRSLINSAAAERYGIAKAFTRTGRWREANGDGFLRWYSEANIDTLARDHGVALVYTHLDAGWLDVDTQRMRQPIEDRLRHLVSKNGWFVPAGTILDRLHAMAEVRVACDGDLLTVRNGSKSHLPGVTLLAPQGMTLDGRGRAWAPDPQGKIVIGAVGPHEEVSFRVRSVAGPVHPTVPH